MSLTCYEEIGRVERVHEDAARKLLPWNLGFSDRVSREGKAIVSVRPSVRLSVCFYSIF